MAESTTWKARIRARIAELGTPGVLALIVTAVGLVLRIEHAITFDGPGRGSDYGVHLKGVRWMLEHWRPFHFAPEVPYQVRYYPPLWYGAGAMILRVTHAERAIAALSVGGWVIRQFLLGRLLKEAAPQCTWSRFIALFLHAVLPLGVLIDGKVNPEGPNAGLFMIAVYALWRMERQANDKAGISIRTALLFGLIAGIALLTKVTSAIVMLAAGLVLVWRAGRSLKLAGWTETWRRLLRPAMAGVVVFCLVVGWWCGPNWKKYGHPFPHVWDLEKYDAKNHPEMLLPAAYRRPLGWILPLDAAYLRFPVIRSPTEPRPNFWGNVVAGTWADFYNRGFCRLKGGGSTDRVWGAAAGWMSRGRGGPEWSVSYQCIDVFRWLMRLGICVTVGAALAVIHTAWRNIRTSGRSGSLALPVITVLGVFFTMLLALIYPFDGGAVLNARYLLAVSAPMTACFGMALARFEARRAGPGLVHVLSCVVIFAIGALLVLERFGS